MLSWQAKLKEEVIKLTENLKVLQSELHQKEVRDCSLDVASIHPQVRKCSTGAA
jgi:hypothetical protein